MTRITQTLPILLSIALWLCGCGPAGAGGAAADYEGRCKTLQTDQNRALQTKNYQPTELLVYEWPKGDGVIIPADGRPALMPEAAFVAALRRGKARTTLLTGGAGVGKSTLTRSLRAQLCGEMPVAAVDLAWGLTPADKPGVNPLFDAVARELGAPVARTPLAAIRARVSDQPFVLLLDAFDEVGHEKRETVARYVRHFAGKFPAARLVVLSRPPVYAKTRALFGEFDANVGLPFAACNKIDWFLTVRHAAPWEKANFYKFTAREGLLHKVTTRAGCRYSYLQTYRDLDMIWTISQPTGDKLLEADFATTYKGARGTLMDFYLKGRLLRGFEHTKFRPEQAITVIQTMVSPLVARFGKTPLSFTQASCERAVARAGKNANVESDRFCAAMLASAVFAGKGSEKHFASRTIGEYFVALHIAAELGKVTDGKCAAVASHKSVLESTEIAAFLIGTPAGGNCLAHVLQQLCLGDMPAAWVTGAVRRGLPHGEQRIDAVGNASEKIANTAPGGACVERVLAGLAKQ